MNKTRRLGQKGREWFRRRVKATLFAGYDDPSPTHQALLAADLVGRQFFGLCDGHVYGDGVADDFVEWFTARSSNYIVDVGGGLFRFDADRVRDDWEVATAAFWALRSAGRPKLAVGSIEIEVLRDFGYEPELQITSRKGALAASGSGDKGLSILLLSDRTLPDLIRALQQVAEDPAAQQILAGIA
jgi:hypothetical protein